MLFGAAAAAAKGIPALLSQPTHLGSDRETRDPAPASTGNLLSRSLQELSDDAFEIARGQEEAIGPPENTSEAVGRIGLELGLTGAELIGSGGAARSLVGAGIKSGAKRSFGSAVFGDAASFLPFDFVTTIRPEDSSVDLLARFTEEHGPRGLHEAAAKANESHAGRLAFESTFGVVADVILRAGIAAPGAIGRGARKLDAPSSFETPAVRAAELETGKAAGRRIAGGAAAGAGVGSLEGDDLTAGQGAVAGAALGLGAPQLGRALAPVDRFVQTAFDAGSGSTGRAGHLVTPGGSRPPWAKVEPDAPTGTRQGTVLPGDNTKIETEYAVLEAEDVKASHTADYAQRPADEFPPEIQGRAYHGDAGQQAREFTEQVVSGFDPERAFDPTVIASEGPPVVTRSGVTVAGNGRVIAQQRLYRQPARAKALLKEELAARAGQFGLDPDAVRGMRQPVLVRRLVDDVTDTNTLRQLNLMSDVPSGKAKDVGSDAAGRAAQFRSARGALDHFAETVGDQSINEYLGTFDGVGFLRRLVEDNVIASAERARYIDVGNGVATPEGKQLVERMFFAAAIGDADVVATAPSAVLRKMTTALPSIIRADQVEGWAIGPLVRDALETLTSARANNMTLNDFVAQGDLLSDAVVSPRVTAMARFLDDNIANSRPDKLGVKDSFRRYAADAEGSPGSGEIDLFAGTADEFVPKTAAQSADDLFGVGAASEAEIEFALSTARSAESFMAQVNTHPKVAEAQSLPQPGSGRDTWALHGGEVATPEREALRQNWLATLRENAGFADAAKRQFDGPVATDRQAVLILGPPASGKSTIANPVIAHYRARLIDSDEVKNLMPEFEGGRGAGMTHEESSFLAGDVMFDEALSRGENIVRPTVGADPEDVLRQMQGLQAEGYTVHLLLNEAAQLTSLQRAFRRLLSTGRYVRFEYILGVGDAPLRSYEAVRGQATSARRFFNADDTPIRLVEESGEVPDALRGLGSDRGQARTPDAGTPRSPEEPGTAVTRAATADAVAKAEAQAGDELAVAGPFDDIDPDHVRVAKFALDANGDRALAGAVERVIRREAALTPRGARSGSKLIDKPVETFETTRQVAESMGLSPSDIIEKPGALGRHEMVALRDLVNRNIRFTSKLDERLATGHYVTPEDEAVALELMSAAGKQTDNLLTRFIRQRTEDGRNLAAHRILANQSLDPFTWYTRAKTQLGGVAVPADIKARIDTLIDTGKTDELAELVNGLRKSPLADQINALWKAGLLSAPTTHQVNIISTAGNLVLEGVKDIPAAMSDRVFTGALRMAASVGALTRGHVKPVIGRSKSIGSLSARALGRGIKRGAGDSAQAIRGRGTSTEVSRRWDYRNTTIDFVPSWLGGKIVNPMLDAYQRYIFRTLGAEDKFFKGVRFEQSVLDQANVAAMRGGNKKDAGKIYDLWRQNGYELLPDEVFLRAAGDAEVATFTDRSALARIASSGKQGVRNVGAKDPTGLAENAIILASERIAPFTGTPTNIVSRVVEYAGGGYLKGIWDAGRLINQAYTGQTVNEVLQRQAMESFGRALVGTGGFVSLGYMLYKDGKMTLNYPGSSGERGNWELLGKQEFSILQDGRWHSMERFSPIGNVMAVGGYLARSVERGAEDPESDFLSVAAEPALGLGSMVMSQSFLEGASRFLDALQKGEDLEGGGARAVSGFVKSQASSNVPNIIRRVAQSMDTNTDGTVQIRTTDNWKQAIQASIPFMRQNLPLGRDSFGTVKTRKSAVAEFVDITYSRLSTAELDMVRSEFSRLGAPISRRQRDRAGGETGQQYSRRLGLEGKALWENLHDLVRSDLYRSGVYDQAGELARTPGAVREVADNLRRELISETITRTRSDQTKARTR